MQVAPRKEKNGQTTQHEMDYKIFRTIISERAAALLHLYSNIRGANIQIIPHADVFNFILFHAGFLGVVIYECYRSCAAVCRLL